MIPVEGIDHEGLTPCRDECVEVIPLRLIDKTESILNGLRFGDGGKFYEVSELAACNQNGGSIDPDLPDDLFEDTPRVAFMSL